MSLFQNSVVNKYLKEANHAEMRAAYQKLQAYFQNSVIQQNIRESKEEQFQEGFLRELFVHVLGYTINPDPDYNLTTEFKNERGARKADGAIVRGSMLPRTAIGVIELKSTITKDLESIRLQAFDYKANHSKCELIKVLMEENNLKAKDLIEILGLLKGTISKILNYHKGLSKETIRALSKYFKISQEAFNRPYKLINELNKHFRLSGCAGYTLYT